MSLIKNVQKYSHCILGKYEIRPPTENEKGMKMIAGIDADQFYESSGSGGAVPFKFLAELKMAQHGDTLFDSYFNALKITSETILKRAEEWSRDNNIGPINAAAISRISALKNRLAIRIRCFIPRIYVDKIDTEILWYIKGDEKGTVDFDSVCKEVGVITVVLLGSELMKPIKAASDAIRANIKEN